MRFHTHELKLTAPISLNGPSLKPHSRVNEKHPRERKEKRKKKERKIKKLERNGQRNPLEATSEEIFLPPLFTAGNRSSGP
ncbi:hypothetical protein CEXT_569501 [Caerostris extrusa]|uniref:Uncharacterized protein n=1 Tax=Caerostris extrusa TaxID=172846 RepID=A0AAV4RF89_CAEEX|nr:hypothetical protein CEXT_569501 [Caerostris extrusa]